jgi:leucine-rich repeat protein SHOC2
MGILALGGNRLVTLPEEIGRLTSLTSLSVPGNRLESLDALACGRPLPELRALGLFGNCLREVPEGVLGRFPGLTELWLQVRKPGFRTLGHSGWFENGFSLVCSGSA